MLTHRLPVFHHIERYIQRAVTPRDQPGLFIEDEQLYDDDKTGHFTVAAYNMVMLLAVEGQQHTGRELTAMLAEVGFTDIDVKPPVVTGASSPSVSADGEVSHDAPHQGWNLRGKARRTTPLDRASRSRLESNLGWT